MKNAKNSIRSKALVIIMSLLILLSCINANAVVNSLVPTDKYYIKLFYYSSTEDRYYCWSYAFDATQLQMQNIKIQVDMGDANNPYKVDINNCSSTLSENWTIPSGVTIYQYRDYYAMNSTYTTVSSSTQVSAVTYPSTTSPSVTAGAGKYIQKIEGNIPVYEYGSESNMIYEPSVERAPVSECYIRKISPMNEVRREFNTWVEFEYKVPWDGRTSTRPMLEQFYAMETDTANTEDIVHPAWITYDTETLVNALGYMTGTGKIFVDLRVFSGTALENDTMIEDFYLDYIEGANRTLHEPIHIDFYQGFVDADGDGKDDRDGMTDTEARWKDTVENTDKSSGTGTNEWGDILGDKPDKADYTNDILGNVEYGFDTLMFYIKIPFKMIGLMLSKLVGAISDSWQMMTSYGGAIANVFNWLPADIRNCILIAFICATLALVYRLFRGV